MSDKPLVTSESGGVQ